MIVKILLLGFVMILINAGNVSAQGTTLQQSILPLSCSVNSVNSGVNVNVFITPDNCPEEVIPDNNPQPQTTEQGATETTNEADNKEQEPNNDRPSTELENATPETSISDQIIEDPQLSVVILAITFGLVWSLIRFYGSGSQRAK